MPKVQGRTATIDAVDHLIHVGRLITDDVQNGTEVF